MIDKKNYKAGDKVMLIGYPSTVFTIKRVSVDTSNNIVFSLVGVKPTGQRIKFEKDESHVLCSIEEFEKAFS